MFNMHIQRYPVQMSLGVFSEERKQYCLVLVGLKCTYSLKEPKDQISQTLNYADLIEQIDIHLKKKHIQLIETAVDGLGEHVLKSFSGIRSLEVSIEKTSFPNNVLKSGSVCISKSFLREGSLS